MKKIFAIMMTVCLMVTALSVASLVAFAAEATADAPASGTVLRVSALKKNVTAPVVLGDYNNFEDGWNYAMGLAGDTDDMKVKGYDRIVVDFYADWIATGSFTDDWINGDGFDNDTIYIPDDAKVTLNLKGHTINRGLTSLLTDGEVIYIDTDADVTVYIKWVE